MNLAVGWRILAGALVVGGMAGCSGGRVPVEGTVTFDGKPLASATVTLQRTDMPTSGGTYRGETDGEGRYVIKTADANNAGASPGSYHVFVTTVKVPPDANETTKLPQERVPPEWRDGSHILEVPAEGTTDANFAITSH